MTDSRTTTHLDIGTVLVLTPSDEFDQDISSSLECNITGRLGGALLLNNVPSKILVSITEAYHLDGVTGLDALVANLLRNDKLKDEDSQLDLGHIELY